MKVGTLNHITRFLSDHDYAMPVVVRIGDQEFHATWAILPTTKEMDEQTARLTIVALTTDAVPARQYEANKPDRPPIVPLGIPEL